MTVILLILKIIGIFLLSLLGIALFLLALVWLVPVRYRIHGEHGESVQIEGSLHWLLHLVKVSVSCQKKEWDYGLYLCGFRLRFPERKAPESDEEDSKKTDSEEINPKENKDKEKTSKEKELSEPDDLQPDAEEPPGTEKFSGIRRIKQTIERVLGALKELPEKIADIKNLLTDETNKKSVSFVFAELKYLLRHSRFRRIKTELEISLGDPAATGMGIGALSMFPVVYQKEIRIYPDFEAEKAYVWGYYEVRGHVRLVHLAVSLLRLWKKKEFRIFVKHILKQLER